MRRQLALIIVLLLGMTGESQSRKKAFVWDDVTQQDWDYHIPEDSGASRSYILHEKIEFDDKKWNKDKSYLTVYRRIRIRSTEARKWGDAIIPYYSLKQKVMRVQGRTILPDGSESILDKNNVFEQEVIRTNKQRIKQTAFSVPGVTDDCIVEYHYRIRVPFSIGVWRFQQDIAIREASLHWLLYAFHVAYSGLDLLRYGSPPTPNHLVLNYDQTMVRTLLPSEDEVSEILFSFETIPALIDEPFSLPDVARKTQLHFYYGSRKKVKAFWDGEVMAWERGARRFCKNSSRMKKIVKELKALPSQDEKIRMAYQWIQTELGNSTYDSDIHDRKSAESLGEVLKRGYATAVDLNYVFYGLLRELDIDVYVALVTDRDERLFIQDAKYAQFDHLLVAVEGQRSKYHYYSPGDAYLKAGQIRWQNEGITVMICGIVINQFRPMPYSKPVDNRLNRTTRIKLSTDGGAYGGFVQEEWGHKARAEQLLCLDDAEAGAVKQMADNLKEQLVAETVDVLTLDACEYANNSVVAACSVSFAHPNPPATNRWVVNPFNYMNDVENPFTADTRESPIVFDYAYETNETVNLSLPDGWTAGTLPTDTAFSNWAGSCKVHYTSNDSMVTVNRQFTLKRAHFESDKYARVKRLFQTQAQFGERAILLQQ